MGSDPIQSDDGKIMIIFRNTNSLKLRIKNEDHSLGYVLESLCLQRLSQMFAHDLNLFRQILVGYVQPHPLDDLIEFNVTIPSSESNQYTHDLLLKEVISDLVNNLKSLFISLTPELSP